MADIIKCTKCGSEDISMFQEITAWQEFDQIDGEWESTGELDKVKETGRIEFECKECENVWQ